MEATDRRCLGKDLNALPVGARPAERDPGRRATFTKTLTVLSFLIPYLEAKTDPELQQDWLDSAKTAQEVALLLDPPRERETTPDQIDTRITKLTGEAEKLERQCKGLLSRFEPAALKKLVADCQSDTVALDPSRIMEIEALLATPFATASSGRNLATRNGLSKHG